MKIWMILVLPLLLAACGSQLRQPFCRETLSEIPEAMVGTYTMTLPKKDPGMNNATIFETQTIQITKNGVVTPSTSGVYEMAQTGIMGGARLCKIEGDVYLEKVNDNSTYTITKIEATQYGLAFSDISFNVEDLKRLGAPFIVVPNLQLSVYGDTFWNVSSTLGSQPLIVDNSKVPVEVLLKIGKRVSMYMTFKRVTAPIQGPKKFLTLTTTTTATSTRRP